KEKKMHYCTVVDPAGAVVWSSDPALVRATRTGTGSYRLEFSAPVVDDAIFVQPLAPYDDTPRSLLAWPAMRGPDVVLVRIDAHFVAGAAGGHTHRNEVDMRFSFLRCLRREIER